MALGALPDFSIHTDEKGDALEKAPLVFSGASVPVGHQPCHTNNPKLLRQNRPEQKERIILESDVCR